MIIKFCPVCAQKPYTTDLSMERCPNCGAQLATEMVSEFDLGLRTQFGSMFTNTFSDSSSNNFGACGAGSNQSGLGFNSNSSTQNAYGFETDNYNQNSFGFDGGFGNDNFFGDGTNLNPTDLMEHDSNKAADVTVYSESPVTNTQPQVLSKSDGGMPVVGKLTRYSVTDGNTGYKRMGISKLIDAVFYRQRMEDVLHRFTVRVDQGKDVLGHSEFKDIPVNVHGIIASGMQLDENSDVEVFGKYKNNILMANSISILNSGYKSKVNFQHSRKSITYGVLVVIALIFFIGVGFSSNGSFFGNIKEFLTMWLICAVVLTVLYFLLFFTKLGMLMLMGKKSGFPIGGILLISFICALLFMNVFGLGTGLSGLFSGSLLSWVPIVIMVIGIIFLIRIVFKR